MDPAPDPAYPPDAGEPEAAPPRRASPYRTLAEPPRPVPALVRARIIFGGIGGLVGWGLMCFSSIFLWTFAFNADTSWRVFRGSPPTVPGVVTRNEETSMSEGGSKHRAGTKVYAVHYRYDAGGQTFDGVSYSLGSRHSAGEPVTVEHLADRPGVSRIAGLRNKPFSTWAMMIGLFPLGAIGWLAYWTRRGLRASRLLRDGRLGRGVLVDKRPTSTRVNNRMVYELTFAFIAEDAKEYRVKARSHDSEHLEDQVEEPLLYDPLEPSRAVLLDNLPGRPRIDETGQVRTEHAGRNALVLALPIAAVVGNLLWASVAWSGAGDPAKPDAAATPVEGR